MLVKDEADIIGYTIEHLLGQVDYILVADNMSSDGTRAILDALAFENPGRMQVIDDFELGYYQDRKTTDLAMHALRRGFGWVLPCDADEFWYANGRTVQSLLDGLAPDVQIVTADLFDHVPSALDSPAECPECGGLGWTAEPQANNPELPQQVPCDPGVPSPFERIGWRKRERAALPKVCARARPDLQIHMGNHAASTAGTALTVGGLVIRHYSWRSSEQYVRKIRNGQAAYAATDMPESTGQHWRMFEHATDEAIAEHFRAWFWTADPYADDTLIYDPAPL